MRLGARTVEVVRALAVLALVCLNFAHVPVVAALQFDAAAPAYSTGDGFCGDAVPAPGEPAHSPCQACRIGTGADLPPPCGIEEPVFRAISIVQGTITEPAVRIHPPRSAPPRGPPIA